METHYLGMISKEYRQLRIIDTGVNKGSFNMAVDEALAIRVGEGKTPPVLRFYRWEPACLSLGCFQKHAKELNPAGLKRQGVDLVRRPSGGRAVLHDNEITYSIIIPDFGTGVVDSYRTISAGLLAGLHILDLDPVLQKPAPSKKIHSSAACFDSPSSYELLCGGKKLIGSAQRRIGGVILQHGSIPFTLDAHKLYDCLLADSDDRRERLINIFNKKATSLFQEAAREIPYETVRQAFMEGFRRELAMDAVWSQLSAEEKQAAQDLDEKKYSAVWWTEKL